MEEEFPKEKFFEIMGKSYDLEDSVLYQIMDEKSTYKDTETQADKKKQKYYRVLTKIRHKNILEKSDSETYVKSPDRNNAVFWFPKFWGIYILDNAKNRSNY